MADSDVKIAVAATGGEAVRGDLRSFVNERVKRFKELCVALATETEAKTTQARNFARIG